MSTPMDISLQIPQNDVVLQQNGVSLQQNDVISELPLPAPQLPPTPIPPPMPDVEKVSVSVEVCLKHTSTARVEDVKCAVERLLENRSMSYVDGPIMVPQDDPYLGEHVQRICICDTDEWLENHDILLFWQVKPVVHVFQLSEEGPCEDLSEDGQPSSFNEWILPAKEFDGLWESLIYESSLKQRLLRYAASALLFTEKGVDPCLVSWNRIVLLHGPPGTGKTSLCKALAQKLAIRFNTRYPQCQLIEVNAHSLFSKWFSESGKMVAKLFSKIQEMVEEENNLIFVLIDEIESLAAARSAALSRSEPSDSIRVVNALLTQLDKLKSAPNVIILTTSNITTAIDTEIRALCFNVTSIEQTTVSDSKVGGLEKSIENIAFVDRADIKAYVGPPTVHARYEILRSCLQELLRAGVFSTCHSEDNNFMLPSFFGLKERLSTIEVSEPLAKLDLCDQLLRAAESCEGLSGRSLRKLPFLAHAALENPFNCHIDKFLQTMIATATRERSELPD